MPHIHVRYQEQEAVLSIGDGEVLGGQLKANKLRLVQAWIEIHRDDLMADWQLASQGQTIFTILRVFLPRRCSKSEPNHRFQPTVLRLRAELALRHEGTGSTVRGRARYFVNPAAAEPRGVRPLISESVYSSRENLKVNNQLDIKRITIFLAFAFGIAWLIGLVIYFTGGLIHSPEIVPGSGITLSLVLLAGGYMWAPAWAHLLTRLITREGWNDTYLRPRRYGWPYWIAAWFIPSIMTILGAGLFFVVFQQYFDPSLKVLQEMLAKTGQAIPNPLWTIVIIQTLSGVLIAPFINSLFTFGEEFGWRAYLQPKLMPLGGRKAILLIGLIWGVWHWPVIAMGHNYGLEYPGAPWLGMLMMVWVTIGLGTFLGWLTVRAGSVWPAVIGHAAINGISGLAAVCVQGNPNPLLGPYPIGLIGSAAWVLLTLAILLKPGALDVGHVKPLQVDEANPKEC